MGNKAGASLSHFLSDFAPRLIPDTEVEVLPMDAAIPVQEQNIEPVEEIDPEADFIETENPPEDSFDEASLLAGTRANSEELRKKAIEEAVHNATTELEAKFAHEKATLIADQQKALAQLRQKTIDEVASNLDANLTRCFNEVIDIIGNDVAEILAAFVGKKMHEDALNDFAKRIAREAMSASEPLIIEGNGDLLKALESKPAFDKSKFVLQPADSPDIRMRHGDKIIATRLDPIINELKGLVQ